MARFSSLGLIIFIMLVLFSLRAVLSLIKKLFPRRDVCFFRVSLEMESSNRSVCLSFISSQVTVLDCLLTYYMMSMPLSELILVLRGCKTVIRSPTACNSWQSLNSPSSLLVSLSFTVISYSLGSLVTMKLSSD